MVFIKKNLENIFKINLKLVFWKDCMKKKNYKKIICLILGWSISILVIIKMSYLDIEMFYCILFIDVLVGEILIVIMDLIFIRIKV